MKVSSSLLAVLTCISLVCNVARSIKFQTRDDASNGGAQKRHVVEYLPSEDAKLKETNGGKEPEVACYENDIGCFQSGNPLTLSGALPRPPDCVAVLTTLYISSTETRGLNYADGSSFNNINRLRTMKGLKILFHGFNQGSQSPWIKDATKAFTNLGFFVIVVDWSKGQSLVKPERSAHDTPMVGRVASVILRWLITKYPTWFHPSLVHAIGFSMGAHAAGFFCRHVYAMTGQKISRLTGLDPASIFFVRKVGTMNKEDADFVDVIHTSIGDSWWRGKVGYKEPLGHVDFYPNGGSTQPGCKWTLKPCSHQRAWRLFLASVNHPDCKFYSRYCPGGYEEAMKESCPPVDPLTKGRLGYYSDTAPGRGVQYLTTTDHDPYCKD